MEDFMWVAALMLTAGSVLALASGLGIMRLPDFYTRMHAAGISDTLCSALILLALVFHFGMTLASLKVILILAFMLFTCPTASHALARTARHNGLQPWMKPAVAGSVAAAAVPAAAVETESDESTHATDAETSAEPDAEAAAEQSAPDELTPETPDADHSESNATESPHDAEQWQLVRVDEPVTDNSDEQPEEKK